MINLLGCDGIARLEDGCQQVPGTTCYQYNVLLIVMLQMSAATELSSSDMSIIQQATNAPRGSCNS